VVGWPLRVDQKSEIAKGIRALLEWNTCQAKRKKEKKKKEKRKKEEI
jgi:hypothetical protein